MCKSMKLFDFLSILVVIYNKVCYIEVRKEVCWMSMTGERLKEARNRLHLSQQYVADTLGFSRTIVTQIELGNRGVEAEEIKKFCQLYGISADYLLGNQETLSAQTVFARGFDDLTAQDQQEILNLIAFKKEMARRSIENA